MFLGIVINLSSMPISFLLLFVAVVSWLCFITILYILTLKKVDLISLVFIVIDCLVLILVKDMLALKIVCFAFSVIGLAASIYFYTKFYLIKKTIRQKTLDQVKNDTYDFYFQVSLKKKILDYSISVSTATSLTKKEIIGLPFWKFLFNNFKIKKINDEEFIISNANLFVEHLDEIVSKFKMYKFTIDILLPSKTAVSHYIGLIQPIYYKDKIVATNVYLYQDKMDLINRLTKKLDYTANEIINQKNVINILMSMSEGVGLFFDYQEKMYYATQSFIDYCDNSKRCYSFNEFLQMIHPDDQQSYIEQSEMVNSINVTRIKFRLLIKGEYFNALEDSLFLHKDGKEYISLVHILSREKDISPTSSILSTQQSKNLLNELADKAVTTTVYNTQELLKKGLSEESDD